MTDTCSTEFLDTVKKHVGSPTGKNILQSIKDRANNYIDHEGMSTGDALTRAANESSEEHIAKTKEATRQQKINILKDHELTKFTRMFNDQARGLLATADGVIGTGKRGVMLSAAAGQKQWEARFHGDFETNLEKNGVTDAFKDRNNDLPVWEETFGKDTGNQEAKGIMAAIKPVYDDARRIVNKFGGAIGELPEFIGRQNHDPIKMMKLSEKWTDNQALRKTIKASVNHLQKNERLKAFNVKIKEVAYTMWKNFTLPLLDHDRIFKGEDPEKFMRGAFDNRVEGKFNPVIGGPFEGDIKFTGHANVAKKASARRVFHFKDGASAYAYDQKYGNGGLARTIDKTLNNMAKNAGLMQKYGVNANAMAERQIARVEKENAKAGISKAKTAKNIRRFRNTLSQINGTLNTPIDSLAGRIGISVRVFQAVTKLQGVMLKAIPDIGNKADQLRANGMGFLESSAGSFISSVKGFTVGLTKEQKTLARFTGNFYKSLPKNLAAKFSNTDSPYGTMTKLSSLSYKLNGMVRFDETNFTTFGQSLAKFLADNKGKSFDKLNPWLQKNLTEHGMESSEWDLMRHSDNVATPWGNGQYITPDAARGYTDDSIASYLNKSADQLKPHEIQDVKDNMEFALRSHFINNGSNLAMLPGAREMAIMNQGLDPNSIPGAAIRMMMQFKGYAISFTRRKLGRIFGRSMEEGFGWKYPLNGSETVALAQMMAEGTAYGYLGWSLISLSKGETPPNPAKLGTMLDSMVRGNVFGIYGDFLMGQWSKYNGIAPALAGPSMAPIQQAANVMVELKKHEDPRNALFNLARNNMPLVNLWYAKAALNYAFLYALQEKMAPGSIDRMQDSLEKHTGQQLILDPNQYALGVR